MQAELPPGPRQRLSRRLSLASRVCAYAWFPLAVVLVGAMELAGVSGSVRLWGLLVLLLLPLSIALAVANVVLRHRWIRTPASRSDVARTVGGVCIGVGVLSVICLVTGLIVGPWWVAAGSAGVLLGVVLVGRHEMRHTIPGPSGDGDHSSVFNSMNDLTSSID